MRIRAIYSVCILVFLFDCVYTPINAREPSPLPRRATALTTETKQLPPSVKIPEKPKVLLELAVFKIELKTHYPFGADWNKISLEKYLGKPLHGEFVPSMKDENLLIVDSLLITDLEKIKSYLSAFGKTTLLYRQNWSQELREQVTREIESSHPYITLFEESGNQGKTFKTYAQSSVKLGMTITITIEGLQISGDQPSVDATFEINLKDAYKTKDGLIGKSFLITADSTTIPLSYTLIQTNLFKKEDIKNEYVFLLTPRKVK